MARFLLGFLTASLIWGGLLYALEEGIISINLGSDEAPDAGVAEAPPEDEPKGKRKRSKWRKRKNAKKKYRGQAMTGDDLGDPETRQLAADQAGGEEQLTGHDIEQGFDSVFPKIRRCLILAADDEPVTGKIVFGMRVSGSGKVTKVNLKGPAAITRGEAGGCMRGAARSIKFRSFDGPDMLVHFPLHLD